MKKISVCLNCERELYTNDLDLCKKCNQEVGLEILQQQEPEEIEEEEEPSMPESMVLESEGEDSSDEEAAENSEKEKTD